MKAKYFLIHSMVLLVLFLGACTSESTGTAQVDQVQAGVPEPPAEYAGMTNPLSGDSAAVDVGQDIYQANCASCHGTTGEGDGPAAGSLNPAPGNLAAQQMELSDAYLYWRIAEGGMIAPFNSVMPSWEGALSEQEIWQVITYIRTLDGS